MEYHNKILCVSFSELTDGIINRNTLRSSITRKNIECVRRGGGEGCEALYAWWKSHTNLTHPGKVF